MKIISTSTLPDNSTIALHLIREEIRFRRLTRVFDQAQLDIQTHAPDLASIILSLCGFEEHTDGVYSWYFDKLDEYVPSMDDDDVDLKTLALNFFIDIQIKSRSAR